MKSITKLSVILLAAAVLTAGASPAPPDTMPDTTNASPAMPRARRVPHFQGTIASVDTATMTLTLKGKADVPPTKVKVTSTTKIYKDRNPGTFADAVVGLRVSGSGKKGGDGVWEAGTLRIITAPEAKPAPSPGGPPSKQE